MTPETLQALPLSFPNEIKVVFTDVDDTLTWQGRLPVATLQALEDLQAAGIKVIPVTGGCGGWADCLVRTWPVDTVIAENGSFWLHEDDHRIVTRDFHLDESTRNTNLKELFAMGDQFRAAFPMIDYTHDQDFRLTDIAFDIGQHVKIDREIAQAATQWWLDRGVLARCSSIHINVWKGDYSKAVAAKRWLSQQEGLDVADCIFIGDSPNDDSMFTEFPLSVGVANIGKYLEQGLIPHLPTYLTSEPGGYGFCQLARSLLSRKT